MDELFKKYEAIHVREIVKAQRRIRNIFNKTITDITFAAASTNFKGDVFSLSAFPLLKKEIDRQISKTHKALYEEIVRSVVASWKRSNDKNDDIVDRRFADKEPSIRAKQILYDPNAKALTAFTTRKEKGLNLSKRIWNGLKPMKTEMEKALSVGISEGKSAAAMARDLKQYLNEPDKLFRRVRDKEGNLKLSKAAREYHPGRGVYRSSYKNALRLSRTENNMAYRNADFERWQNMDFVIGVEIRLSANHPRYDICDSLAGIYPKTFNWSGWHPQCLCFAVPKMNSAEDFDKQEEAILLGNPVPQSAQITAMPKQFNQFVANNKTRIEGWSNKPYWVKNNQEVFNKVKPANKPIPEKSTKQEEIIRPSKRLVEPTKKYDLDVLMNAENESFAFNMNNNQGRISGIQKIFPDLKPEEVVAIEMYGNTSYRNLNKHLRDPDFLLTSPSLMDRNFGIYQENFSNVLNSGLDKLPNFKGTVYRGGDFNAGLIDVYKESFKKGQNITEKAFTSTSQRAGTALDGNTFFIIESKTGKAIDDIMEFGYNGPTEREVLFKKETKFKITEITKEKGKNGRTLIKMIEL